MPDTTMYDPQDKLILTEEGEQLLNELDEEQQAEMGELWDGEKWVKSSLVPFGYYAKSLEHRPEPLADTSTIHQ